MFTLKWDPLVCADTSVSNHTALNVEHFSPFSSVGQSLIVSDWRLLSHLRALRACFKSVCESPFFFSINPQDRFKRYFWIFRQLDITNWRDQGGFGGLNEKAKRQERSWMKKPVSNLIFLGFLFILQWINWSGEYVLRMPPAPCFLEKVFGRYHYAWKFSHLNLNLP